MQLSELLRRFRVQANDKVEPYFNEDEDVKAWLNDAVEEACIRGRLVHESQNGDVCKITVTSGNSHYVLHEALYEITSLRFDPDSSRTCRHPELVSEEYLDRCYYENWRELTGRPMYAVQSDTALRLVPMPDEDGELKIEGYRTPPGIPAPC